MDESVEPLSAPLGDAVRRAGARVDRVFCPVRRAVTYTRWLHLMVAAVLPLCCASVYPGLRGFARPENLWMTVVPLPLLLVAGWVPQTRRWEGLQARLMLLPGPHTTSPTARLRDGGGDSTIAATPSRSVVERLRTTGWLVLRLQVGLVVGALSLQAGLLTLACLGGAGPKPHDTLLPLPTGQPWLPAVAPLPPLLLVLAMAAIGRGMAAAAGLLLGPSPRDRLAALEERAEWQEERNRLAGELHDSIGHALTLAVVQAGAARASGSSEYAGIALGTIEESARGALEDLERVLGLLRAEESSGHRRRPHLGDVERLLASSRAAGLPVRSSCEGPLDAVPRPVSETAYRIVQEGLTNTLRHAVGCAVGVQLRMTGGWLSVRVHNGPPPHATWTPPQADRGEGAGCGLRGLRERAELLGGDVNWGVHDGGWLLRARLPVPSSGGRRGR